MNSMQTLAGFIAGISTADLPGEVIERTKRHILDTLGAAFAGSASAETRAVLKTLRDQGAGGNCAIWGEHARLTARDAALVNGVSAHALELDDTGGCDHSGAVVLPAALAACGLAEQPVTGSDLVAAVVAGYDVGRRVLEACGGYATHNGTGWHSTGTCGAFGSAAAAARILRLSPEQTLWALGHAASYSSGLWAFVHDGSQTKRLHTGKAAEGGLMAALLARNGVTGASKVFEDVWGGFFNTFVPKGQQPEALTADLGQTWKLLRCSIKPHASCRSNHGAIDALLHLRAQHEGLAQRIGSVDVRLSKFVMSMCGGRDLATLTSAQMSMAYGMASAWVFGDANLERYLTPTRNDGRLVAAMSLVRLHPDDAMADLDEPEVTVHSEGRPSLTHRVAVALGAPTNPLSSEQLLAKFHDLAKVSQPLDRASALAQIVLKLEEVRDLRDLLELMPGHADEHALIA
ncbi:MmgE/PrpD family protein [Variovorax sp. J31P207]|uniref:MmgE/PrpD family protein n=1 Tax=Variovorax sp. J31P207 TaxID=3053510 RepID=UPI0025767706|nr:MmgE/PrpD family protein [Variovorax sp. J31P207]MDM0071585.1 MmgE/PrpD family protein [Variovorax sp. J31P207]